MSNKFCNENRNFQKFQLDLQFLKDCCFLYDECHNYVKEDEIYQIAAVYMSIKAMIFPLVIVLCFVQLTLKQSESIVVVFKIKLGFDFTHFIDTYEKFCQNPFVVIFQSQTSVQKDDGATPKYNKIRIYNAKRLQQVHLKLSETFYMFSMF